jgi:hypothetical protein
MKRGDMKQGIPLYKQLEEIVAVDQQPTLLQLYSPMSDDAIRSLFSSDTKLTSPKSIIVYGLKQYFGNDHSTLVIDQILEMKPSAFMKIIESLCLNGCGFISHELFTDGHVCKHPDRSTYLDCAHSISRKLLASAMALASHEASRADQTDALKNNEWDTQFSRSDDGIVRLDRALGEIARGPKRVDSVSTLSGETRLNQINDQTQFDDLVTCLPVLGPELTGKQAEYGEPLLRLAREVAPMVFGLLRRRLLERNTRLAGANIMFTDADGPAQDSAAAEA